MKIAPDTFDAATDIGDRYRNLESSMGDVGHMVEIATRNVFALTENDQHDALPEALKVELTHSAFLMFQLRDMFEALAAEYDAGFRRCGVPVASKLAPLRVV